MNRRAVIVWLVLGAAALGVAGLAVRYTVFFDAGREWYRLVHDGPPAPEQRAVLAARHHPTPTPCLRYPATERDFDAEEALATELVAAEIVERAGKAMLLALAWEITEENASHAMASADEVLDLAAERAGAFDRLLIAVHRRKLVEVADMDMPRDRLAAMQQDAEAALSGEEIARLRGLWEKHKLVFAQARHLADRVRRRATDIRLDALESTLQSRLERDSAFAAKLEELRVTGAPANLELEDGWGSPISLQITSTGARLISLGPNMRPDGGDDIAREVATAPSVEPPAVGNVEPPSGPPPFDCAAAPPARVELQRPDPATLQQDLARYRLVPEQVDGKQVGVRLFGVRSDRIAARAGLCNGDRLVTIDGRAPPSTDRELGPLLSAPGEKVIALSRRDNDHTYRLIVR